MDISLVPLLPAIQVLVTALVVLVRGLTRPWKTADRPVTEVGACVCTSGALAPAVAVAVPTTPTLRARRAAKTQ